MATPMLWKVSLLLTTEDSHDIQCRYIPHAVLVLWQRGTQAFSRHRQLTFPSAVFNYKGIILFAIGLFLVWQGMDRKWPHFLLGWLSDASVPTPSIISHDGQRGGQGLSMFDDELYMSISCSEMLSYAMGVLPRGTLLLFLALRSSFNYFNSSGCIGVAIY